MPSNRTTALAGALTALLVASGVRAQPEPAPTEHDGSVGSTPRSARSVLGADHDGVLAPGQRRVVPDYDGRPETETSAGEAALWIPRVLFAPLYLVTEYLVRRPLGWLFYELERHGVLQAIPEVFTFFPDRRAGIIPTALFEFGFRPSVGVYAFWNRFLFDRNRISLQATTWGADWLMLTIANRTEPSPELVVEPRFAALRRPDQLFGGIGWTATRAEPARFGLDQIDASVLLRQRPWRRSALDYEVGYRSASFESRPFDGDPGVAERGPLPAGFADGYSAVRIGARARVDSREIRELSTGGVIAGAFVEHHLAFGGVPVTRWLDWGGALALATDVLGQGRVLSLSGQVRFISTLDDTPPQEVPFTELIELGGDSGPMRGFRPGLARGYSLAAVSLTYVWPVWVLLDASLRLTVGNAFGPHLEDFALDRLRLSFDVGVRPRDAGDHLFELLVGLGTETFGGGTSVVSVRLAVGARSGL